jgi:predicted nuclease of predicted toxin-antitoxin system
VKFLTDEDMPRSLAPALRGVGLEADDVRDIGLQGRPDSDIFAHAVAHGLTMISEDLGFANVLQYPPGAHAGIVIARFPSQTSTRAINGAIVAALRTLTEQEILGNIVILEPGRMRLRRATPHDV